MALAALLPWFAVADDVAATGLTAAHRLPMVAPVGSCSPGGGEGARGCAEIGSSGDPAAGGASRAGSVEGAVAWAGGDAAVPLDAGARPSPPPPPPPQALKAAMARKR